MKKILLASGFLFMFVGVTNASAQNMMGYFSREQVGSVNAVVQAETMQDEIAGKAVWEKLQTKEANCEDLRDEDFDVLGNYIMAQMMGSAHAAMNQLMVAKLGEVGETQMHVVMGKRFSGCDASATYPSGEEQLSSMMTTMAATYPGAIDYGVPGAYGPFRNWGNFSMIGYGFSGLFWVLVLLCVLWWTFIAIALVLIIRRIIRLFRGQSSSRGAISILEERYAKGEISNEEFATIKKGIVENKQR